MIAEDKIAEIKAAARISDLVAPYVTLKRSGRSLVGLCPFHSEKSPSFSVNDENGFFHCFGCGVGGNVFKFLMMIEAATFPEAVHKVADHCGISVPESSTVVNSDRDRSLAVAALAARYFSRCLEETPPGRKIGEYLNSRGVSEASRRRFALGAAPPSGSGLLDWLKKNNADLTIAEKLGLLGRSHERFYDKFRGRVIFPIRDSQGRVVGFGGRVLGGDDGPKYLNTSDSSIYKKGKVLYGLYESRQAGMERSPAERSDRVLLVEGYLDVISLHQAGVQAIVATCGTALTSDQARLIKRHWREVIAVFDGDKAGRAAATRSFPIFVEVGLWPKGAFLAEGEDPDSLVQSRGSDGLEQVLEAAVPLAETWVRSFAAGEAADGSLTAKDTARAGAQLAEVIGRVSDRFERDFLIKKAALWTDISEQALRGRAWESADRSQSSTPVRVKALGTGAPTSEEWIVTLVAADPECVARIEIPEDIGDYLGVEPWATALRRVFEAVRMGQSVSESELFEGLPDEASSRVSARLTQDGSLADQSVREQIMSEALAALRRRHHRQRSAQRLAEIRRREDLGQDIEAAQALAGLKSNNTDA